MNKEDEGLGTNHAAHFSGVLPDIMVQSPGVNKLRKVKQSEKDKTQGEGENWKGWFCVPQNEVKKKLTNSNKIFPNFLIEMNKV